MGEVGGYDLHLYCDFVDEDTGDLCARMTQFASWSFWSCQKQARHKGWLISKNRIAHHRDSIGSNFVLCPDHSGKKVTNG
jgi:hypothetical protein